MAKEEEETVSKPFKFCSSTLDLRLLTQHLQPVSLTRGWVMLSNYIDSHVLPLTNVLCGLEQVNLPLWALLSLWS